MTLADHIEAHGLRCVVCRTDVAAAGVAPGDGHLYCHPCHRAGRKASDPIDGQLDLFAEAS